MRRVPRPPDAWLLVLAASSLAAWSLLALDGVEVMLPAVCTVGAASAVPLSVSVDLALALNSPAALAWGWALMVAAMMAPLAAAPLRHVCERSFARRRPRAMLLFAAGYAA